MKPRRGPTSSSRLRVTFTPRWLELVITIAFLVAGTECRRRSASTALLFRARTPAGAEIHWTVDEVVLEPIAPSPESGLSSRDLLDALASDTRAWNEALDGCAAPRLRVGSLRLHGEVRDDGRNVVVVRATSWCPADRRATEPCYEPDKEATTDVRPRDEIDGPRAGEIREADIEVNAVNFRFSLDGDAPGTRSLRAVLGHELGHVLGLAHSCAPHPAAVPAEGEAVSACAFAGASSSIMYPDPTEPGRPLVLEPGQDAVQALCGSARPRNGAGCARP